MDETGHTFRARLGTTWAPVGQVRVLKRLSRRREVSSVVLLTAPWGRERPKVFARHFVGAVHDKEVIAALRYFRRRLGRPLVIIWDRLQAHRSKAVSAWLQRHSKDVLVEWLPPYAPDLNPEEGCNGVVKEALLNATPPAISDLMRLARKEFRALQHRPDVLRSFFEHAGLHV
ncbi:MULTISPECIES: transposase [Myxococcus]|uniref:transposase n=1 Tax=Myxococcus TaxID=32 RepID=UPI0013900997|nr:MULTISPECIES: transposase [Myxococcus]NOK07126.1 transposase [Myxococcus xanthus]